MFDFILDLRKLSVFALLIFLAFLIQDVQILGRLLEKKIYS